MCAPLSPNDEFEQTFIADDINESASDLIKAIEAHCKLVVLTGIKGATSAQLRMLGINPNAVRAAMENAIDAYRATCRNCQEMTSGTRADSRHLDEAQRACIERNDRNLTRTAMRRADTAEAADAALTAGARARGAEFAASLPAYGSTAAASCAELARETDPFDYGRSAPARPHAAGVHSASAA